MDVARDEDVANSGPVLSSEVLKSFLYQARYMYIYMYNNMLVCMSHYYREVTIKADIICMYIHVPYMSV